MGRMDNVRGLLLACTVVSVVNADTLYYGGAIYTMDSRRSTSKVIVSNGVIKCVGDACEADDNTEKVDLEGKAMFPAFVDGHSHMIEVGEQLVKYVDVSGPLFGGTVQDIPGLVAKIRESPKASTGEWILAARYDQAWLKEGRQPTKHDLDQISTDKPVYLEHLSGHMAVVNSKALEMAGIDSDTVEPEGCRIHREAGGREPSGVIEEVECLRKYFWPVLPHSDEDQVTFATEAVKHYASKGYGVAQQGYATPMQCRALEKALKAGHLKIRVVVLAAGAQHMDAIAEGRPLLTDQDPTRLRLGGIKFWSDGSVSVRTAYLSTPYRDPGDKGKGYRGYPTHAQKELVESLRAYHEKGHRLAVHANGDGAIDAVLNAFEEIRVPPSRHPVIIHSEFTRPDQIHRMAGMGVSPSFFNLHTYYYWKQWMEWAGAHPHEITPVAAAVRAGLNYSLHTDSPVVNLDPMRVVWGAVTRRRGLPDGASGEPVGPSESVSLWDAFHGITAGAAQQWGLERCGTIKEGNHADLVVLSEDPFTVRSPDDLLGIHPVLTVVGGEAVYSGGPTLPTTPSPGAVLGGEDGTVGLNSLFFALVGVGVGAVAGAALHRCIVQRQHVSHSQLEDNDDELHEVELRGASNGPRPAPSPTTLVADHLTEI